MNSNLFRAALAGVAIAASAIIWFAPQLHAQSSYQSGVTSWNTGNNQHPEIETNVPVYTNIQSDTYIVAAPNTAGYVGFTNYLPLGIPQGRDLWVRKTEAGTNVVWLLPQGTNTGILNGAVYAVSMSSTGQTAIHLTYIGTNWVVN